MSIFQKVIENQKSNFEMLLENVNKTEIDQFVDLLIKHIDNNIYFAGVGKSGNLAIHLADLFKSVGLKAFNLNILNSTHGDLGVVKNDDLIIFLSKSGNTKEILDTVKLFDCEKVLACCNLESKISSFVGKTFYIPLISECDLIFNSIPTNSISNTIVYFNFILNIFLEKSNLSLAQYKLNHPSGDIGFKNKKVSEFISNEIYICNQLEITVKEVMILLKTNKMGLIFEENKNFYGIITTKDILNLITTDINNINKPIRNFINTNPVILNDPDSLISNEIETIKNFKFFKFIPVIKDNVYIGIIDNSKILKYI
tara:strand:+ start:943 stop:1881 length:939 start_codon:yes stop_codon:yes gene_type:complete